MATTTNYGWTTPDDTALVKDGASAIRTLGTSVDTTTKNLNPSTTLGDIEYRSSTANTNTRLGIGTTGQVLSVTGGVPAWETVSSGGMTLISTTTLTGASVTLSSIPATYINLRLVIRNHRPVSDSYIRARFNGVTTSSYFANDTLNAYFATNSYEGYEDSYLNMTGTGATDASSNENFYSINFEDYTNTATHKIGTWNMKKEKADGTGKLATFGMFVFENTSAISSIVLSNSTGDFTSGTALLYGVK